MLRGRCKQQRDGHNHKKHRRGVHPAHGRREAAEQVLKHRLELEAEQDLASISRRLSSSAVWNFCSTSD
jgi:hypothetical protein